MGRFVNIDVSIFDPSMAPALAGLAQRAFSAVSEGAQPALQPTFAAHLLGSSNPAGQTLAAWARKGEELLGSLVGLPVRYRCSNGSVVTGYQIGFYFVDQCAQGQGIGSGLLTALTAALTQNQDSFIYTFPNSRSIGRFYKHGFEQVGSIPTYIYPSCASSFLPWKNRTTISCVVEGSACTCSYVDPSTAHQLVRENCLEVSGCAGFIRDAAYFAWRYGSEDAGQRYRFAVCQARDGDIRFLLVLSRHCFSGIPFTIAVDLFSKDIFGTYTPAIRAARGLGSNPFVYANTNLGLFRADHSFGLPFGIRVPHALNPRPVELLYYPAGALITREELHSGVVLTADWLGF